MARLSKEDRIEAEVKLRLAREYQTQLWSTLSDLESLLGSDIEAHHDLEHYSVDDLRKGRAA